MAASESISGGLAPPTPLPCERCGGAPPTARLQVGGRRVCLACAELLDREARPVPPLWPTLYVFAIGILSPVMPPVLAALNWARLGEPRRVRSCLILALGGAFTAVGHMVAVLEKMPRKQQWPFDVAALAIAFFSTLALGPRYAEHRARGGRRANLLAPVAASFALMMALFMGVLGYLSAAGKVDLKSLAKPGALDPVSLVQPASRHPTHGWSRLAQGPSGPGLAAPVRPRSEAPKILARSV